MNFGGYKTIKTSFNGKFLTIARDDVTLKIGHFRFPFFQQKQKLLCNLRKWLWNFMIVIWFFACKSKTTWKILNPNFINLFHGQNWLSNQRKISIFYTFQVWMIWKLQVCTLTKLHRRKPSNEKIAKVKSSLTSTFGNFGGQYQFFLLHVSKQWKLQRF